MEEDLAEKQGRPLGLGMVEKTLGSFDLDQLAAAKHRGQTCTIHKIIFSPIRFRMLPNSLSFPAFKPTLLLAWVTPEGPHVESASDFF
jgi:hypothetical protein